MAAAPPPAAAPAAVPVPPAPKPPARPNFLLIVIDTIRYDDTTLGSPSRGMTPELARLGKEGIEFTRAYSTFDSTPESHFSILTGMVNGWMTDLDRKEISAPSILRKAGYRSFGIAANANLSAKFNRMLMGFERYTCLYDEWQTLPPEARKKYDAEQQKRNALYGVKDEKLDGSYAYIGAPTILAHLEQQLGTRQPFFGFINIMECHDPYLPSPRFYKREAAQPEGFDPDVRHRKVPPELEDPSRIADAKERARIEAWVKRANGRPWSTTYDLTPADLKLYHQRYRAEVRQADDCIQQILQMLERKHLRDSTIVIITGDHGESFGEEGLITHSFSNGGDRESTHHVPMLFVFPPSYALTAARLNVPVTIGDIAPTIYEIAGIDDGPIAARALPGNYRRSLLPRIERLRAPEKTVVAEAKPAPVSPKQLSADREEAMKRLRSLGYIH